MRARAIGQALAAFERVADQRMGLEALEFLERRQIRIRVVEVHDEADRHQIVVEVIEERAAAGRIVERPAERVLHQPGLCLSGATCHSSFRPMPNFCGSPSLRRDRTWRSAASQAAARAFGEQRVFGAQLHAAGEARIAARRLLPMPMSPVATPATAPSSIQHFGGGEARIDFDAERFRLGRRASGRRCRARRCSCRDCSSAAAS